MSHHSIEIYNLTFHYPDGHLALDDVTLAVAPGEKIALVGPNGAGKSTLMLHLNGILQPTSGTIQLGGLEVVEKNYGQIRAWAGLVFQDPDDQLFSPTVFDDVAFGPLHMGLAPDEVRKRVREALQAVHMDGYEKRLSHHLSMGEKKRIAIATVLSMDPLVLILDEPTAGLDPRARRSLIHLLDELPQTMVVASHDMRLVDELFPRMVIMDAGKIVADAPTPSLMANEALLEKHGLEPACSP
jgi:cobalt/nickel transport system ATP-binding protein